MSEPTEETTGPGKRKRRPVSIRRIEANKRNAQLSTGPRTPTGKASSSRSALKHGIYASIEPIDRGALREDPLALQITIDNVMEALLPRNGMERAAALRVATIEVQIGRHHAMEALQLSATTSRSAQPDGDGVFDALYDVELFQDVARILRSEPDAYTSEDWYTLLLAAAAFDKDFEELVELLDPQDLAGVEGLSDLAYRTLVDEAHETPDEVADVFEAMAHEILDSLPDGTTEVWAAVQGIAFRMKQGHPETQSRNLVRLHAAHARELDRDDQLRQQHDRYGQEQEVDGDHARNDDDQLDPTEW